MVRFSPHVQTECAYRFGSPTSRTLFVVNDESCHSHEKETIKIHQRTRWYRANGLLTVAGRGRLGGIPMVVTLCGRRTCHGH